MLLIRLFLYSFFSLFSSVSINVYVFVLPSFISFGIVAQIFVSNLFSIFFLSIFDCLYITFGILISVFRCSTNTPQRHSWSLVLLLMRAWVRAHSLLLHSSYLFEHEWRWYDCACVCVWERICKRERSRVRIHAFNTAC